MGYTEDDSLVRVDFFKESGKWYCTEALKFRGYNKPSLQGAFKDSLNSALYDSATDRLRLSGMTAICLEPYHFNAHPISVKLPSEGMFILDEFEFDKGPPLTGMQDDDE